MFLNVLKFGIAPGILKYAPGFQELTQNPEKVLQDFKNWPQIQAKLPDISNVKSTQFREIQMLKPKVLRHFECSKPQSLGQLESLSH
jgi:hypothetical protein